MIYKKFKPLVLALLISVSAAFPAMAETATTTMENSGAYLFEWRPVDCGDGHSFAILVGGNTIYESDVILSRGYDYAYTFKPSIQGLGDRFLTLLILMVYGEFLRTGESCRKAASQ